MNRWTVFFIPLWALCISCTQHQSSTASLKFQLPGNNKVNSSMCSNCSLDFAAINLHIPGQASPIVRTKGFKDSGTSDDLNFVVENLDPNTGVVVQFLAVVKDDSTGVEKIAYGDRFIDLVPGENAANITSSFFGEFSKTGRIGGRLIETMGATPTGPTGTLIGSFNPPAGSISPFPMDVIKEDIINGWFSIFVLNGNDARFNYRLEETGEVLFQNINIDTYASKPNSFQLLKAQTTASYDLHDDEPKSRRDYFMGFFGVNASVDGQIVAQGTFDACYLNGDESVPDLFVDALKTDSFEFKSDNTGDLTVTSGSGVGLAFNQTFNSGTAGSCDVTSHNKLRFNHQLLAQGDDLVFGFHGPFRLINPFNERNGLINSRYDQLGNPTVHLDWEYQPGVTGNDISGVTVYATQSNGSDGGLDDEPCDLVAEDKDFTALADVPFPAVSYAHAGVSSGSQNQWKYMLCPYKDTSADRHYYLSSAESYCRGNCINNTFGHGIASAVHAAGSFDNHDGAYGKVTSSTLSGNVNIMPININGTGTFSAGDEVLLSVVAEGNNGCGLSVQPGMSSSTRVLDVVAGPAIKIPKGSFMDLIPSGVTLNALRGPAVVFCYVQAVKVPNYKNLVLTGAQTALDLDIDTATNPGGVIAYRVNGILSLGGDISVEGLGFNGGIMAEHGQGNAGMPTGGGGPSTGSGGATGTTHGGGGGGFMPGGFGTDLTLGSEATPHVDHNLNIFYGGGGGGATGGSGYTGAPGGGSILLAANKLNLTAASEINATGDDGIGGTSPSTSPGSGGAGGINLFTTELYSAGGHQLNLEAKGGNGTFISPAYFGGGGGGGFIHAGICEVNNNSLGTRIVTGGLGNNPGTFGQLLEDAPHYCN